MQSQPALFELLFKRNATDDGHADLLKEAVDKYPYFSAAQFYLLQQSDPSSEEYAKVAARTSLLFNDPLWLNYQLQPQSPIVLPKEAIFIEKGEEENVVVEAVPEETIEEKDLAEKMVVEDQAAETAITTSPATETNENAEEIIVPQAETIMEQPTIKPTLSAETMLFEPMHMVDYFASQGIKLSEEVQTGDKLGKQLKSFTEWLKTMKKVHVEKLGETGGQTEIAVQTLAEKSNTEDEVVTESMAEVFAMQGKLKKAIETYEKLSLLNPSKSAFFAAKIEQLKG